MKKSAAYYYLNFRESHKITRLITMPLLIKTSYNTLLILEKINIIYYLIAIRATCKENIAVVQTKHYCKITV